jgi:hypothetical protein
MVFLLDSQPYAYLVPSMPISARAIGVNNNLVHPGASGRLWRVIEAAVRTTVDHYGASKIPPMTRASPMFP